MGSNPSPPISDPPLGMGDRNHKDDLVLFLKDRGIWESRQHTPACVSCIGRIMLRMSSDQRHRGPHLCEECVSSFRAPLEIPLERRIDLFSRFGADAKQLRTHRANRARNGASTSSQELVTAVPAAEAVSRRSTSAFHEASISASLDPSPCWSSSPTSQSKSAGGSWRASSRICWALRLMQRL